MISHAQQVATPGTSVAHVSTFAQIFGGGTYSELIWALGIVAVLQVVLTFTRWGIYTVSVGSNRLGAAEAGINVPWNLIRNFVLCAPLAGLVGDPRGRADDHGHSRSVGRQRDPVRGRSRRR